MKKISTKGLLIGSAIVFALLNLILIKYDFYYLLGLPIVGLLVYALIKKPISIFYLVALATPISVQLAGKQANLALSIPTEPLIILLFIGLILRFVQLGKINTGVFYTAIALLITSDFAWLLITSITSTMPMISAKYALSKLWYLLVFYFLATYLFKKTPRIKVFLWCFIIGTVLLSLYTVYQHSLGGFSRSYAYSASKPFIPDHGMYAAAISFAVPVLFVFSLYGEKLSFSMPLRVIAAVMFTFLFAAVILSFTRASWLSLAVSFAVFGALLLKIKFRYLLVIGLIGLSYVSYNFDDIVTGLSRNSSESADNIEEHLESVSNVTSDPSNMERLNRWSCAYRMFEDKPIMGFGPGTYTFQYGVYQLPHQMTIISTNAGTLGNVHSEYLRPLVESGLPGFLFYLLIVIATFFMGFRQFRKLEGQAKYLSLAVFLGLVTYFTHGVLNNYSEFDKIAVPYYGFLAIMTTFELKMKQSDDQEAIQK